MDKKIGRIVTVWLIGVLFLIPSLYADLPTVLLEVLDQKGNVIQEVGVGVPFMVQATVTSDKRLSIQPVIKGLGSVTQLHTQTGTQMRSMNGKTTVTEQLTAVVKAQKIGNYSFGPATISYNGQQIASDTVTVDVVAHIQQQEDEAEDVQAFLKIEVDRQEVYVGEPVIVTIRFYQTHSDIALEGISKPDFDTYFTAQDLTGPTHSSDIYKGKKYRTTEWKTIVYPKESGQAVIAPIEAVYSAKMTHSSMADMFSLMENFFGGMHSKERISSNAVSLSVIPLPEHVPFVKAVGVFTAFKSSLNNQSAAQGEGLVYKLELEGKGNFDQLSHPIIHLTDGLTSYESNSHFDKNSSKKVFEYVIQGLRSGEYTIPAQQYVFFDREEKVYKTVVAEPVTLTITPGTPKQMYESVDNKEQDDITESLENYKDQDIYSSYRWKQWIFIPWKIFWSIVLLLLIIISGVIGIGRYQLYQLKNAPEIRYKNAFKIARSLFYKARSKGYVGQLYHIYRELFSSRLRVHSYELSEQKIEDFLRMHALPEEKIIAWRIHFAYLTELAFVPHRVGEKDIKLFNQASLWLDEWEKIL